ncbi:Uncharacterised protein [Acinetobacter baumannii]|nr:Uncharacterised protein [Acinetobacter baumannii]
MLHARLQRFANFDRVFAGTGIVPTVQTIKRSFHVGVAGVTAHALLFQRFLQVHAGGTAEHHQVQQRVAAQTVGAVHRYAGDFAHGEQPRDHHVFAFLVYGQRLTGHLGRNAAHHIVTGWDNRDRLFHRIDVREGAGQLQNARQTGFQHLFAQVIQLQLGVRAPRTVAAAAFADFDHDRTGNHVAARQIFGVRRITLHEALAVFVQQVTAFAAAAFGHQHARAGDAGRVELPHFHVLHRHAGAQRHADTVAGVDVGVGGGLVNAACAAGRQHGGFGFEVNHLTGFDADSRGADHRAVLVFHQIERIPLRENGGVVFQVLLV